MSQLPIASSIIVLFTMARVCMGETSAVEKLLRVGIVGCDTSHAPAFTKLINGAPADSELATLKVMAVYPGGSPDVELLPNRAKAVSANAAASSLFGDTVSSDERFRHYILVLRTRGKSVAPVAM
jgi:hypothetical protein